jgi:hypothetical protein
LQRIDQKELGKQVTKEKIQRDDVSLPAREASDFSDNEDMTEVIEEALSNGIRNWDEEQEYEEKPRTGDSQWKKKESTRLPLRVNGNIVDVEASESDGESSDETEESDSDSDEEEKKEPRADVMPTSGPEAVIEAKEVLARLAEEITESPEERVCPQ